MRTILLKWLIYFIFAIFMMVGYALLGFEFHDATFIYTWILASVFFISKLSDDETYDKKPAKDRRGSGPRLV